MADSENELRDFWSKVCKDWHQYDLTGFRLARLDMTTGKVSMMVLHARHRETGTAVQFPIRMADDFIGPMLDTFSKLYEEVHAQP